MKPRHLIYSVALILCSLGLCWAQGDNSNKSPELKLEYTLRGLFEDNLHDIAIVDTIAYCLGNKGLYRIDMGSGQSPNPAFTARVYIEDPIAFSVTKRAIFVTTYSSGVLVFDISTTTPTLIPSELTDLQPNGLFANDSLLAVCLKKGGCELYIIHEDLSVTKLSTIKTTGSAVSCYINGKYAYIAEGKSGLEIFDLSNPSEAVKMSLFTQAGRVDGIRVYGKTVYVLSEWNLKAVNVFNPAAPSLIGTFSGSGGEAVDFIIRVHGNTQVGYLLSERVLTLIDLATLQQRPKRLGEFFTVKNNGRAVAPFGSYVCVLDESLKLVSVTDNPSKLAGSFKFKLEQSSFLNYFTNPNDVVRCGNDIYVSGGELGLVTLDVANPLRPKPISYFMRSSSIDFISCSSNELLLGNYKQGISAVNLSDLSNAGEVYNVEHNKKLFGMAASLDTLLVANGDAGIEVLTFTDKDDIQTLARATIPCTKLMKWGDYYLAAYKNTFRVIEVSDSIMFVGAYRAPDLIFDMAVSGQHAYLACGQSGLVIVDLSIPNAPRMTEGGIFDTPNFVDNVLSFSDSLVVIDDGGGGLNLIDVSNRDFPRAASSSKMPGSFRGLIKVSGRIYASDREGLKVFSIVNK